MQVTPGDHVEVIHDSHPQAPNGGDAWLSRVNFDHSWLDD
jgi:hypothetical protein